MTLLERLEQLYAIGGGPGANRLGGSAQEDEAHELVAGWMREPSPVSYTHLTLPTNSRV